MYSRNYIDLETVVADIGGFVKFISMIFYFIHYIFSQTAINQKIINKLFFIINEKYYRGFSLILILIKIILLKIMGEM